MEIDKRRECILRGKEANDILSNDTFCIAMDQVMNGLFANFIASTGENEKGREKIWAVGQGLQEITRVLEAYRDSGKVESENKKHDES